MKESYLHQLPERVLGLACCQKTTEEGVRGQNVLVLFFRHRLLAIVDMMWCVIKTMSAIAGTYVIGLFLVLMLLHAHVSVLDMVMLKFRQCVVESP
jgi:hypothetical protein